MSFAPIALTIPQYDKTTLANWWLKAYDQGTTTPLSMATDVTGGTTLVKAELDSEGFPITAGSARFIPFINGDYDLWVFPTAAEADANDTTNAIQFADNLNADPQSTNTDVPGSYTVADKAAAVLLTPVSGKSLVVEGDDGGTFKSAIGAAPGTYSDDSSAFCGTVFIPTGGDGSIAWVRSPATPINVKWFGATGDGVTNDTTALQDALNLKGTIYIPSGTYIVSATLTVGSNTALFGDGASSVLSSDTADTNMITITSQTDVTIEKIKLEGVLSTSNGAGIYIDGCTDVLIDNIDVTEVSGDGVRLFNGTSKSIVSNSRFYSFNGAMQDSSDINFYYGASYCKALNNQCHGANWHGIKAQSVTATTTNHCLISGNTVGVHTAYGIIMYSVDAQDTYHIVDSNLVENISGDALIGGVKIAGAGIYDLACGGDTISNNYIRNTNNNTAIETLTPAGIAVSSANSSCDIIGNTVQACDWYGIASFSNNHPVNITGNNIIENVKTAIYCKNSNYSHVVGNTIRQVTNAIQGILIYGQSGQKNQCTVSSNTIHGSTAAVTVNNVTNFSVTGNSIYNCTDRGILVQDSDIGAVTGNNIDNSGNDGFKISNVTKASITGNAFNTSSTYAVVISGTCTSSALTDNIISPFSINHVAASGAIFQTRGAAAPVLGTWNIGDVVYDTVPTAGGTIGWVCTTAGTQGTWKTWGAITA